MKQSPPPSDPELIRLNKFIANCGVCSRRQADELIKKGEIKVNGKTVTEVGTKVGKQDQVNYKGKLLNKEKLQYVLLNKPKDFISTTKDERNRKTVMILVENACSERIFPVGRLDRKTTGLLLFTNDGELSEKLLHPSNKIVKLYKVKLNKPLQKKDMEAMLKGTELEDGITMIDELSVLSPDFTELGVEIHSGKNRIIRRIFENYDYDVVQLDRTIFAGLTKKDLPRGKWRHLTVQEIRRLRHFL